MSFFRSQLIKAASKTDPFFGNVELLLNMDGSNGSTTFTDLSNSANTVTAQGNAQVTTSRKKFGTGSLELDGTGDALSITGTSNFDIGTSQYALEGWMYIDSFTSFNTLLASHWSGTSGGYFFYVNSGGYMALFSGLNSLTATTGNISAGSWNFFAWYQNGSNMGMSVNGTEVYSGAVKTLNRATTSTSVNPKIGCFDNSSLFLDGAIDDLRLTIGTDRGYTGSGAPIPVEAFLTK